MIDSNFNNSGQCCSENITFKNTIRHIHTHTHKRNQHSRNISIHRLAVLSKRGSLTVTLLANLSDFKFLFQRSQEK